MDFHDRIAQLSLEKFRKLGKTGKPKNTEWTILSCIIQENCGNFEVVALGTGSKCIGKQKMSKNGDIINDSHAEVMCRRAFLQHIYQLIDNCENQQSIIKFDPETRNFRINNKVKFHFFTTHVPCGDATIFPKDNTNLDEPVSKKPKIDNDIFRTGAKCLETDTNKDLKLSGSGYHVTGAVRTKPGRGDPTLSVSCSDKLSKWCHLGLQGALLNFLISEPIYLSSFTIIGNTPFSIESLKRAIYSNKVQLNDPFYFKEITIKQANSLCSFEFQKNESKNPCPSSIAWFKTNSADGKAEVSVEGKRQGVTKKQRNSEASQLAICKLQLFKYFVRIIEKFELGVKNVEKLRYGEAKLLAESYQKAWQILKKDVFKIWPKKSDNLLYFCAK